MTKVFGASPCSTLQTTIATFNIFFTVTANNSCQDFHCTGYWLMLILLMEQTVDHKVTSDQIEKVCGV